LEDVVVLMGEKYPWVVNHDSNEFSMQVLIIKITGFILLIWEHLSKIITNNVWINLKVINDFLN
jgi:hypothetical protein